jgi:DNA mismatch repair ATPase MutS
MYNKNNIFSSFKLPIFYLKHKKVIDDNLKSDLELLKTIDQSKNSMYNILFNPTNKLGEHCLNEWGKYYTDDKQFIKDSQKLYLQNINLNYDDHLVNKTLNIWKNIKNEKDFCDKYEYIDIEKLKWLNNSSKFLCLMSLYNLSSPVLNLLAPIFICIIPFILLKITNKQITFENYSFVLINQIKNHTIGKLFYNFSNVGIGQKLYILLMTGLYFYNIYQNIITCYKFYNNTNKITDEINNIKLYTEYSIQHIKLFLNNSNKYKTYKKFNDKLLNYQKKLQIFYDNIKYLPEKNLTNYNISYIGKLMNSYYNIYYNKEIEDIMYFTFGFHGYLNTLKGLSINIKNKKINKVYFSKKKNKMKNTYHPSIKNNIIKNDVDLNKNIVITGPNASGKTTLIKSVVLNILFSHQIGFGYFEKANIKIYNYIHCYINIPDTSSRDSLFQAEVRRCKKILNIIENNKNKNHFCIFDELFSGTNPYEAISTGNGYLEHLSKQKNVTFILTTHFMKLCYLFNKNKNIVNKNMNSFIEKDSIIYTYKINNGISKIKGGINILKQFNYPTNIINISKKTLENLT